MSSSARSSPSKYNSSRPLPTTYGKGSRTLFPDAMSTLRSIPAFFSTDVFTRSSSLLAASPALSASSFALAASAFALAASPAAASAYSFAGRSVLFGFRGRVFRALRCALNGLSHDLRREHVRGHIAHSLLHIGGNPVNVLPVLRYSLLRGNGLFRRKVGVFRAGLAACAAFWAARAEPAA